MSDNIWHISVKRELKIGQIDQQKLFNPLGMRCKELAKSGNEQACYSLGDLYKQQGQLHLALEYYLRSNNSFDTKPYFSVKNPFLGSPKNPTITRRELVKSKAKNLVDTALNTKLKLFLLTGVELSEQYLNCLPHGPERANYVTQHQCGTITLTSFNKECTNLAENIISFLKEHKHSSDGE